MLWRFCFLGSKHGGTEKIAWILETQTIRKKTRNYRGGQRLGDSLFGKNCESNCTGSIRTLPACFGKNHSRRMVEHELRRLPFLDSKWTTKSRSLGVSQKWLNQGSSYGLGIVAATSTWSHSDVFKTINHKASVRDPSSKSSGYQLIPLKISVYKHGRRSAKEIMKHRLASGPRGICGLDLILHLHLMANNKPQYFFVCVLFHVNKFYLRSSLR